METLKLQESAEECNSSESGWTMYIVTPGQSKANNTSHQLRAGESYDRQADDLDKNSDDSMVSDASSGPSHQEQVRNLRKNYVGKCKIKGRRGRSYKSASPAKKNRYSRGNEEKDHEAGIDTKGISFLDHDIDQVRNKIRSK